MGRGIAIRTTAIAAIVVLIVAAVLVSSNFRGGQLGVALGEMRRIQEDVHASEMTLHGHQAALSAFQDVFGDLEIDHEIRIEAYEQERDSFQEGLDAIQVRISNANRDNQYYIQGLEIEESSLMEAVDSYNTRIENANRQHHITMQSIEVDMDPLRDAINVLSINNAAAREALWILESEIQGNTRLLSQLQEHLTQLNDAIESIEANIASLYLEINEKEVTLSDVRTRTDYVTNDLYDLRVRLGYLLAVLGYD